MSNPIEQYYLNNYNKLLVSAAKLSKKPYIAKDVMQQLYLQIRNLSNEQLTAIEQPSYYVYVAMRNTVFNYFKSRNKMVIRELEFQHPREFGIICMEEAYDCMEKAYRLELIAEFSNTLYRRQKAVLSLMLKGYSSQDIAIKQGNKYNTVKHNKRLIVEKLREFFKQKGEDFYYGV